MIRLAISGAYCAGKTTTTVALAHLTGLPRTHARTMREILPDVLHGKRLEDCTPTELLQLGMIRYTERAVQESWLASGFISDGSALHEWVYGTVRMRTGTHGANTADRGSQTLSAVGHVLEQVLDALGAVLKRHARNAYDAFVHLPIEFPIVADGHRPVSEEFRATTDQLLLRTLGELGITVHVVGGSLGERLQQITSIFDLPVVMPVSRAIDLTNGDPVPAPNGTYETGASPRHAPNETSPV